VLLKCPECHEVSQGFQGHFSKVTLTSVFIAIRSRNMSYEMYQCPREWGWNEEMEIHRGHWDMGHL
jgi:hypothetical protein